MLVGDIVMDISELKRELLKYKESLTDLWRSL